MIEGTSPKFSAIPACTRAYRRNSVDRLARFGGGQFRWRAVFIGGAEKEDLMPTGAQVAGKGPPSWLPTRLPGV